jgi:long-chain fatty acid transport protein
MVSCALLLKSWTVQASPLLDLVGDTTGAGGLQAGTVPGGSAAAYFNPALLLEVDPGVSIGFMMLSEQIGITLDGRPGSEFAVPEGIENAGHANGDRFDNYPIATNLLQYGRPASSPRGALVARPRQAAGSGHDTFTYEVIGLVIKLFQQRLAIGVHALIPNGQFTQLRAFYDDEREQYFSNSLHPELYSDRLTALSLAFAAGFQLTDALSLGVGATLSLKATVGAPTYVVDTGNLGKILIDIDGGVNVSVSPHFGVNYKLGDRLRLTATAHAPERVDLGTSFKFLLANGIEQQSGVTLVHDFTPWQFGMGTSYDLVRAPGQTLSLAATLLYVRWSDYLDRHGANPGGAYTWSDTISPTVGVRYRWQKLTSFLDLAYAPSPVPAQTGRTNYVDNDRLSGSAGAEYRVRLWGTELRFGAQLQAHRLIERHQTKLPTPTRPDGTNLAPQLVKDEVPDDAQLSGEPLAGVNGLQTNNPGWPGFTSQGWILASTLYLVVTL